MRIGVVGSGTMGGGIAQVAAHAGFETLLYDVSESFLEAALTRVRGFLARGLAVRADVASQT